MMNMNVMNEAETREANGGAVYMCKICGYRSTSYWKTYANALKCVTTKYGRTVLSITSFIFG